MVAVIGPMAVDQQEHRITAPTRRRITEVRVRQRTVVQRLERTALGRHHMAMVVARRSMTAREHQIVKKTLGIQKLQTLRGMTLESSIIRPLQEPRISGTSFRHHLRLMHHRLRNTSKTTRLRSV